MKNSTYLVIMAGGIGSRFWPLSTVETPKQFLDIVGTGKSLFQQTIDRFKGICPIQNIFVVTSARYSDLALSQCPGLLPENILKEPCMRNTAPCIAYAAWKIMKKNPEARIVVTPSDHMVTDTIEFQRVIRSGLRFITNKNRILTLGIRPSNPSTGYGYIQADAKPERNPEIFKVSAFREKPDLKTAVSYLEQGNYSWNSGLFLWSAATIREAFNRYLPEVAEIFSNASNIYYSNQEQDYINHYFPACPNISIDYSIMEKADNIYTMPCDFGWSDLGTWGSLFDELHKSKEQNVVIGDQVRLIDAEECIVHMPLHKKVVVQGLKNYIVAESSGTLLICNKNEEQRIREFSGYFNK